MPVWVFVTVAPGAVATVVLGLGYLLHGNVNAYVWLLTGFLSVNLLICYWEICLFLRRDLIEERSAYWQRIKERNPQSTIVRDFFLRSKLTPSKACSPTFWADVWALYSIYDPSYADRRTFGFNVDVANGVVTPIASALLLATFAFPLLPATIAGIIGIMVFWQWLYMTSVYVMSFYIANRHRRIRQRDVRLYVWVPNSPWILLAFLGLYVSVRLVLDGNYGVLSP